MTSFSYLTIATQLRRFADGASLLPEDVNILFKDLAPTTTSIPQTLS